MGIKGKMHILKVNEEVSLWRSDMDWDIRIMKK